MGCRFNIKPVSPTQQGRYTFNIKLFDGHLTVDGLQFEQDYWYFVARDSDNELPITSFSMTDHDGVTASMKFNYDVDKKQYYSVINYFYENTFTIDDCNYIPGCDNDVLHFDLYQNNRGVHDIPTFIVGETVSLDASASSDYEGEKLSYLWSVFFTRITSNVIGRLPIGEDKVSYDFTVSEAGNYYASLCVQEAEHKSIYRGPASIWRPLYLLPQQRCPQIQFKVIEKS